MKKNIFSSRPSHPELFTIRTLFVFFISLFFTSTNYAQFFETSSWYATPASSLVAVAWSPDGKYVATATMDGRAYVYSFDSSTLTLLPNAQYYLGSTPVSSLAWTPDGRYLAVGGDESPYQVRLLSFNGSALALFTSAQYTFGSGVNSLDWSPDGKYLAIGGSDPAYGSYDVQILNFDGTTLTRMPDSALHTYGSQITTVKWSPNGQYLAVGGKDPTYQLQVFSFDGYTLTHLPAAQHHYGEMSRNEYVTSVAWRPDGNYIAMGGTFSNQTYYDVKEVQLVSFNGTSLTALPNAKYDYEGDVFTVSWTPDGQYLTAGGRYPYPIYMEIQTFSFDGTYLTLITGGTELDFGNESVRSVTWSPDGTYLAAGGYNTPSLQHLKVYKKLGIMDGIRNNYYFENQVSFPDSLTINGNIYFKNGFSLSRGKTLDLDIISPIYGAINLDHGAIANLNHDIYLGSNASLTSDSGTIKGNGHTIFLSNNFTTIDNTVLRFSTDTVIDGQGSTITLGRWSQLWVDTNVTLTLKNLKINNTINNQQVPFIKCATQTSKLALDNIELSPKNDFCFDQGQLYIHNDVVFTGTSQFIYKSSQSSFITPNSMLTFEPNTTFFYDTVNSYTHATYLSSGAPNYKQQNNQLINMQDATSGLYLDGCTLHASHTGLRLTKGKLFFDSNVTLENNTTPSFSHLSESIFSPPSNTLRYSPSWSPDGKYLTVSEYLDLRIYKASGSTFTEILNQPYTPIASWSPDNKTLATFTFYAPYSLTLNDWNGSTLTPLITPSPSFSILSMSWSPDGKFLAVGDYRSADAQFYLVIYGWDGTNLTVLSSTVLGGIDGPYPTSLSWNPNGNFLIVGKITGGQSSATIYGWDGITLIDLGPNATQTISYSLTTVAWNPDGRFFATAASGGSNSGVVSIFEWDGSKIINLGSAATKNIPITSLSWNSNGTLLAMAIDNSDGSLSKKGGLMICSWDGIKLTSLGSEATKYYTETAGYSVAWNPKNDLLAVGTQGHQGGDFTPPVNGFINIYEATQNTFTYNPAYNQSIFFGDSKLGPNSDLDINLLKNAKVTINGTVWHDNN